MFLGTQPTAHFLKLDTKRRQLMDLGRPSAMESYIWDVTFGSDSRLYGATFPHCKLVRLDPRTGQLEDLGRMDPTEEYARFIVGSADGFLYIGIGSSKANIAAYKIETGEHREILPVDAQVAAIAKVFRGTDGSIYGMVGNREFRLTGWKATEVEPGHVVSPASATTLRDGRTMSLSDDTGKLTLAVTNPETHKVVKQTLSYQGRELQLFRICFGPDGFLYGSTILPMELIRTDVEKHRLEQIGHIGEGEIYSFLVRDKLLLMAGYSGPTTLMSYEPGAPFHPATKIGNPRLVSFRGDSPAWRPMALINGPDGNVYVGSVASYGLLNAPLVEWNPEDDSVQQFNDVVNDQSIISLAVWHDFVIGGTSIYGGEGSHTSQKEARIFIWNTKTHTKTFDIIPVRGAPQITDLITAPNGLIYGIAGHLNGSAGNTLFVFDPVSRKVTSLGELPFSSPIYNSVTLGKDGKIWGLAETCIFAIDPKSNKVSLVAHSPERITGGFAMRNGEIYFVSGATIYRYTMYGSAQLQ